MRPRPRREAACDAVSPRFSCADYDSVITCAIFVTTASRLLRRGRETGLSPVFYSLARPLLLAIAQAARRKANKLVFAWYSGGLQETAARETPYAVV